MQQTRRPSIPRAALEAFVEGSFNGRKRRSTPPPSPSLAGAPEARATTFEHYKFDGEESSIHLEWRAGRGQGHQRMVRIVTEVLVYTLGLGLGLLVGSMTIASRALHNLVMYVTDLALHPDDGESPSSPSRAHVGTAFVAYTGLNVLLVLLAALLTLWAPSAGSSGLPKLKSYLNGTYMRDGMLSASTLVAKVLGITLITSTNLPLGRDGPMVHIGAMCAAILTRLNIPGTNSKSWFTELRLPAPQREWVAVGAVAGVAAAFNAPIGGILYSFEEVSSSWSSMLTWRSFVCAACVSIAYNVLVEYSNGWLHSGYHIELGLGQESHALLGSNVQIFWIALLGVLCGIIGGSYNKCVLAVNGYRIKWVNARPMLRVVEAVLLSFVVFATVFALATTHPCRACPAAGEPTVGAHVESLGERGCTFTKYRHKANVGLVQHTCEIGEYNEMATLLFSSQEGIVELLFSRHEPGSPEEPLFSPRALASLLGVIFVLSVCIFGIAVPGDNFVPGIVMGGLSGRLFGELLLEAGIQPGLTPGAFALLGAGAVLTGMSRMTITLVAILTEVGGDVAIMPAIIIALVAARIAATRISESFDEGQMKLNMLPFLEEAPPPELNFLTAGNAMANTLVVLPDVCKVRRIVDVLNSCSHNGFPVVYSQTLRQKAQQDAGGEAEELREARSVKDRSATPHPNGRTNPTNKERRPSVSATFPPPSKPLEAGDQSTFVTFSLPPGWTSSVDPQSGRTYYTNSATGEVTWDRPTGSADEGSLTPGSMRFENNAYLDEKSHRSSIPSVTSASDKDSADGPIPGFLRRSSTLGMGRNSSRSLARKQSVVLKDAAVAAEMLSLSGRSASPELCAAGRAKQSIENEVLDASSYDASIKLGGTILRRQLLLLLKMRAWEERHEPSVMQEEYVGSFVSCKDIAIASMRDGLQSVVTLSEEDLDATLDLRRYMDPAPFAMVARTPLPRVYRLFNEIGARHLVVVNDNMSPIGMVTRKDLDVPAMVELLLGGSQDKEDVSVSHNHRDSCPDLGTLPGPDKARGGVTTAPMAELPQMPVTPTVVDIVESPIAPGTETARLRKVSKEKQEWYEMPNAGQPTAGGATEAAGTTEHARHALDGLARRIKDAREA